MLKLYENIRELRKLNSWTQEELASRMGYTDRSMIAKIESGKVDISQSKIMEFAKVFNVEPGYLMGWEDINGEPIARPEKKYAIKITDYRTDFVKDAIEIYKDINRLPPERRQALEEYLRFLLSQS